MFSMISCKTNNAKHKEVNSMSELVGHQNTFFKMLNDNNSLTLYYKVDESINNPVKIFTYYVADSKTKKILKTSEQVAAEKIYWKDNVTLAIIPYSDAMQKNDVVGSPNKNNEILIKINK